MPGHPVVVLAVVQRHSRGFRDIVVSSRSRLFRSFTRGSDEEDAFDDDTVFYVVCRSLSGRGRYTWIPDIRVRCGRFASNDTKLTLYDVKIVGKADVLWIEESDYNYQWLTIVPSSGVREVNLERVRGNRHWKLDWKTARKIRHSPWLVYDQCILTGKA